MNHYRVKIIASVPPHWVLHTDFIMQAASEDDARIIVNHAYPEAFERQITQITFPDYT